MKAPVLFLLLIFTHLGYATVFQLDQFADRIENLLTLMGSPENIPTENVIPLALEISSILDTSRYVMAQEERDQLRDLVTHISQEPAFQAKLYKGAKHVLNQPSDPFAIYLATCILGNGGSSVMIQGTQSIDLDSPPTTEILQLHYPIFEEDPSTLTHILLEAHAETIYIHNLPPQRAYQLYLELVEHYPYFYYHSDALLSWNSLEGSDTGGLFIASKRPFSAPNLSLNSTTLNEEMILCSGTIEVSGSADTRGGGSVEAGIHVSEETNSGTFSTEVKGGVRYDRDTTTVGEVRGTISWEW